MNLLGEILSFIIGGGLVTLLSLPFIIRLKRQEVSGGKVDLFNKRFDSYEKMIKALEERVDVMTVELSDLSLKNIALEKELLNKERENVTLKNKIEKMSQKLNKMMSELETLKKK